jgi:hypothetical protein
MPSHSTDAKPSKPRGYAMPKTLTANTMSLKDETVLKIAA